MPIQGDCGRAVLLGSWALVPLVLLSAALAFIPLTLSSVIMPFWLFF